jgi:Ca-activated chloride channel family protein
VNGIFVQSQPDSELGGAHSAPNDSRDGAGSGSPNWGRPTSQVFLNAALNGTSAGDEFLAALAGKPAPGAVPNGWADYEFGGTLLDSSSTATANGTVINPYPAATSTPVALNGRQPYLAVLFSPQRGFYTQPRVAASEPVAETPVPAANLSTAAPASEAAGAALAPPMPASAAGGDLADALAAPTPALTGTIGSLLAALAQNGLPLAPLLDPALAAHPASLGGADGASPPPIGEALLNLARESHAQLRRAGDALALVPAREPLAPTESFGLAPAAFAAAFGAAPMQGVAEAPRATFALAADTASWELARARLRAGRAVDPRAVEPEQFINAMPQDYPPPAAPAAFALYAEAGPAPFAAGPVAARTVLVALGAAARPAAPDERRPLHLTLAIDCSGSMGQPGGLERIVLGLHELVKHLRPDDRIAVVAFADRARLVLPPTPGSDAARILAAIDGLRAEGSTDCAEGLELACQLAIEDRAERCDCRVLLATDGATLPADAPAAQARLAAARAQGIDLMVLGCGERDVPPAALERLAAAGGGQHRFLASDDEAVAAFAGPLLPERLAVLGRDAKVQVTWNGARVAAARLIGWQERRLQDRDFRNDAVAAGTVAPAQQATALFEVVLVEGGTGPLGSAAVRWKDGADGSVRELSCPLPGSLLGAAPSPRLALLACAAQFAEILQRGWWSNVHCATWDGLLAQLRRLPPSPAAAELQDLVERAQRLDGAP